MAKKKNFISVSGKRYDGILGRCYRQKDPTYKNYGERGIKVCSAWIEDIDNFRLWLYKEMDRLNIDENEFVTNSKKYQVDRKDGTGHYTPDNCRLVCSQGNNRNRLAIRDRVIISAEGEEHRFNGRS